VEVVIVVGYSVSKMVSGGTAGLVNWGGRRKKEERGSRFVAGTRWRDQGGGLRTAIASLKGQIWMLKDHTGEEHDPVDTPSRRRWHEDRQLQHSKRGSEGSVADHWPEGD